MGAHREGAVARRNVCFRLLVRVIDLVGQAEHLQLLGRVADLGVALACSEHRHVGPAVVDSRHLHRRRIV